MQLTIYEVAQAFMVNESIVYRWIEDQQLPAERVGGKYFFNRSTILEWATVRKKAIAPGFFQSLNGNGPPSLEQALRIGGIHHDIQGADKEGVLRAVVGRMPLPASVDREFLLEVFLSREALGTTGIGDGLAIPHPRYPMVLPVPGAFITLCFLHQPIVYASDNSQPVHTLFALVSPTVPTHLGLLAQLASALHDPEFRQVIQKQGTADQILLSASRFRNKAIANQGLEGMEKPR